MPRKGIAPYQKPRMVQGVWKLGRKAPTPKPKKVK